MRYVVLFESGNDEEVIGPFNSMESAVEFAANFNDLLAQLGLVKIDYSVLEVVNPPPPLWLNK